jgi:hypothetical protein
MAPNGIELNLIDPELCRIDAEIEEHESSPENSPHSPQDFGTYTPSTTSSSPREFEDLEVEVVYSTDGVKYYVEIADYISVIPRVYDENMELVRNAIVTRTAVCDENMETVYTPTVSVVPEEPENLKDYIVPNFYSQEHFEEMEDWSEERVQEFKDYLAKMVCAYDPFKEIISSYIETFNIHRKYNGSSDAEESSDEK